MAEIVKDSYGKVTFKGSYDNKAWNESLSYTKVNFADSADTQTIDDKTFYLSDAENDFQNVMNGIASISNGSFVSANVQYDVVIV